MSEKDIEDVHIQGIALDVFYADTNYQIFEKIRINWNQIKLLEKYDFELFNFIKESSKKNCITHLGRIYDRRSERYPTRCLDELLFLINKKSSIKSNILTDQKWKVFKEKYSKVIELLEKTNEVHIENYIQLIEKHISKEKETEESSLYTLKLWRDKRNAHNERYDEEISLKSEDIDYLLLIPKSILSYLNDFSPSNYHLIFEDYADTYFFEKLLEKYLPNYI